MNIKRISALLLTAAMLATSVPTVFAENTVAAADITDTAPIKLLDSDEFYALRAMNFMGEGTESVAKDAYITRAQFCGYLAKLASYAVSEHQASEIPFVDVNISTPYYNEICTMYELGIVSGTDPNMFSPNANVTYAQACKMMTDVLGYSTYAQVKYGEFPQAYVMMASELDIDDGVKNTTQNEPVTAEDAAKLLYNAGNAEIMVLSGFDKNGNPTYQTEGKTLFSKSDIYYGTGVMQSNGLCSLVSSEVSERETIIDGVRYETADADLRNLLGSSVKFFYRDKDNDRKLLWAWEDTRFNNSVEFKAEELAVNDSEYSRTNVVYYKSNGTTKKLKVSPVSYVVYNNEIVGVPTNDTLKIHSGTMRLIDNNDDDTYDVVIIEEFENLIVTGVPTEGTTILGKYAKSINLEKYDIAKIYKDGKEITKSEIGIDSVISYIENASKNKIFMYVTSGELQGKFTGTKTKRGEKIYSVEGIGDYTLAYSYRKMLEDGTAACVTPKVGENYRFWLDKDGEIAEIREGTGSLRYALWVDAYRGEGPDTNQVYTRMVFTDGSDTRPVIDKKLVFDGKKMTVSELYNDNTENYDNKTNYSKIFESNGEFKEQVVKVSLNEDGTIREIDIAKDNTDNPYGYDLSDFTMDIKGTKAVSSQNGYRMIDNKWLPDNSTIVFIEWTGADEDKSYSVSSLSSLDSATYNLQAYDTNENLVPKIMYKKGQSKVNYWSEVYYIVEDIEWVWDNEQEVKKLTAFNDGAHIEFIEYFRGALPDDVEEGDVIRISRYNDRLTNVEKIFNLKSTESFISGTITGNRCHVFAPIYGVSPMGVTVLTPEDDVETYGPIFSSTFYGSVLLVSVYDRETGEVSRADFSAINQTVTPNADGSLPDTDDRMMIFYRRYNGAIYEAIVVK